MSEIEVYRSSQAQSLPAKVQYAKTLADSGLLPAAYRRNPANVLYAVEYGEMLGLPPMAAITGIHIIEGKPTASAGLISALVRRAGHRLRVTGDDRHAVAEIIRRDDPDFTFRAEWTMERAKQADLLGKGTWKKYPAAMLKARAISEVARDACEETLSGVHYTPEELGAEVDEEGNVVGEVVSEAAPKAATDQAWLDSALQRAASFTTYAEHRELVAEGRAKQAAGEITADDAARIAGLIKARVAELKQQQNGGHDEPVEADYVPPDVDAGEPEPGSRRQASQAAKHTAAVAGNVPGLDPEDPWAAHIEALTSAADVETAIDEVVEEFKANRIGEVRANVLRNAIRAQGEQIAAGLGQHEEVPA